MKFFSYLEKNEMDQLFFIKPQQFNKTSNRDLLSYGLGATLYMPATRTDFYHDIIKQKQNGLTSLVIDLEDAVGDLNVEYAESCLKEGMLQLYKNMNQGMLTINELPLLFFRIRHIEQFIRIYHSLGEMFQLFTGVVFPKFEAETGRELLNVLSKISMKEQPFYCMPILESEKVIHKETRQEELLKIKNVLDDYREYILNVRIGATDFSGIYGIRRSADTTVYDISVIKDCIADIINIFQRSSCPYVISGPVWEYFSSKERMLKPQLRQTPFRNHFGDEGRNLRSELIDQNMDGLMREILLDITNGLIGKTIIHPSHIKVVQALNVVTYEEYNDALNIVESATGEFGVKKSQFLNKMNEIKPHYYWAQRMLLKSEVYGVLNEEYSNIDLIKRRVFI
ncbi:HpcH/HpaI aldolase/citrate lyase family protein [Neobacillus sp. PS3-12]|jgi:citrate lyase beta subunit|uniref:HpcH/HpaI aldolase/citrate lyase family protein n=1 Tax=Neobacillus sp. PS3-12 TaxID=3070677 RepID=UPI0027E0D849|nr:HpcH/HpaI aldolase/citrate lyase family protein [Neobacillus sp. PS3-12]WML53810.1 HpcH/HpaI aldolase/citrate lyase family protein [Neobacillus sp. PS3-12]